MIFAPGLIALFISGEYKIRNWRGIVPIIIEYGIYDFATLLLTYLVMFALKGNATIGWGGAVGGHTYPISYINVALKIMGLQLMGSIVVGLCARIYFRRICPHVFDGSA